MRVALGCRTSGGRRCSTPVICLLTGSLLVSMVLIYTTSKNNSTEALLPYVKDAPLFHKKNGAGELTALNEQLQDQHLTDRRLISELEKLVADLPKKLENSKTASEDRNGARHDNAGKTAYNGGNSLKAGLRTDPIVLCIPCLNFEEVRDVAILIKSILLNTKSWMYVWFFAPRDVSRTLNVLFESWDIAQMAGFRVETISNSEISMESLNEKCWTVIKAKFMFLLPKLIFAEDITNLWATNDTMVSTLKNSRAVYNQKEKDSEQFPPDLLDTVYSINGDAFRGKNEKTDIVSKSPAETMSYTNLCDTFKRGGRLKRRTHICFYCYPGVISNTSNDVTMFTQVTFDRLYALAKILDSWKGPASIALHLSELEAQKLVEVIERGFLPSKRANVQYHVVYKRGKHYPVNVLRNVALREVRTKYIFVLDADFVPQPGLHSTILSKLPLAAKRVLVVPAFETQDQSYEVPLSKKKLIEDFKAEKVKQFHVSTFPEGHAPVNYRRWINATSEYLINYQSDFEPYVVLAWDGAPQFAEILVGRMLSDKVEYMYHLNRLRYQYTVLTNGFLVHLPHPVVKEEIERDITKVCRTLLFKELHEEVVIPPWVKRKLANLQLQHPN